MQVNKSRYPRQSRQASLALPSASDVDTVREAKARLEEMAPRPAYRPQATPAARRERMQDMLGPELWARARKVYRSQSF
jgi:hypothetical protein